MNTLNFAIQETQLQLDKADKDLTSVLKAAMKLASNHWMVTNKEDQFRIAIVATMIHFGQDSEEFKQLEKEMQYIAKVNAFLVALHSGLTVDPDQMKPEEDFKPLKLLEMWKNTLEGK